MTRPAVADDALRGALRAALMRAQEIVAQLTEHLALTGEALARGDASNLETYLNRELGLLGALDETFRQQHALLGRHGLSADRQGMETAIRRCADAELEALWRELRGRLEDCRARNRSNARLARQSGRHAQAALQLLRGETPGADAYGPRGDVQSSTGSHTIARV